MLWAFDVAFHGVKHDLDYVKKATKYFIFALGSMALTWPHWPFVHRRHTVFFLCQMRCSLHCSLSNLTIIRSLQHWFLYQFFHLTNFPSSTPQCICLFLKQQQISTNGLTFDSCSSSDPSDQLSVLYVGRKCLIYIYIYFLSSFW